MLLISKILINYPLSRLRADVPKQERMHGHDAHAHAKCDGYEGALRDHGRPTYLFRPSCQCRLQCRLRSSLRV